MRAIIHGWSALGLGSRLITVILTGVAWTAISMQHVLLHPEFWDPVTLSDYVAVYSFSVALLLLALSLLIFRELAPAGVVNVPALLVVAAGGFVVAGVANMLEDGLGFRGFGPVYVLGVLVGVVVLLIAAVRLWMSGRGGCPSSLRSARSRWPLSPSAAVSSLSPMVRTRGAHHP